MKVTKGNAADLYAALIESVKVRPMEPGEFTAKQFATDSGLSKSAANDAIARLVKEGKLVRRHLISNRFVYRCVESTEA